MERGYRPGTVLLEKYRVESELGRGGMAIVLRAMHLNLGEEVALKILLPDAGGPDVHTRFLREAQAVVRLRGEHVTRVLDVGRLPDATPYMVMEYLRGTDLSRELRRRGGFSPGEAVDYLLQACEALAESHSHGIIHRDIKPGNLFLTVRPDGTPLLKVLDFGISKSPVAGSALTNTDTVMGTAGYMSPEQMKAARDVDARTDIWALGVVLYECLNGRPPFHAEAFSAVVLMAATEPPPPLDPRLPQGLEAVVLRCLAKDRKGRFASMAELATALAPFARDHRAAALIVDRTRLMLGGPPTQVEPAPPPAQPDAPTTLQGTAGARIGSKRRLRYTLAGAVSVIGVVAAMIAIGVSGSRGGYFDPPGGGTAVAPAPPAPSVAAAPVEPKTAPAAPPQVEPPQVAPPQAAPPAPAPVAAVPSAAPAADAAKVAMGGDAGPSAPTRAGGGGGTPGLPSGSTAETTRGSTVASAGNAVAQPPPRKAAPAPHGDLFSDAHRSGDDVRPKAPDKTKSPAWSTSHGPPGDPPAKTGGPCDTVDDMIAQAQSQHDSGNDRAALSQMTKALVCRQDASMYRAAAMYACGAHDVAAARRYLANVPLGDQTSIVTKCESEDGIQLVQ